MDAGLTAVIKKWHRDMLDYAKSIGVDGATLEHRGKHPAIVGTVKGQPFRQSIAGTPGDRFATTRARATLRRMLRDIVDPPNPLQGG